MILVRVKVMTSNQSSFSSQSKSVIKESLHPSYSSITAQSLSCDPFMRGSFVSPSTSDHSDPASDHPDPVSDHSDPVSDHSTIQHHEEFSHDYNSTCNDSTQYGVEEELINNNNYECDPYTDNDQLQLRPVFFIRLTHHINLPPPTDTTNNLSLIKSNTNPSNSNPSNSPPVTIQSPSQYHHQGNPRAQLTFAPHQFAGSAAHMNPYPYLVTYASE